MNNRRPQRPKPTLPKKHRELTLDDMEALEIEDWIHDVEKRERKKNQDATEAFKLLKKFEKRK